MKIHVNTWVYRVERPRIMNFIQSAAVAAVLLFRCIVNAARRQCMYNVQDDESKKAILDIHIYEEHNTTVVIIAFPRRPASTLPG